jgi:hypothetical protein
MTGKMKNLPWDRKIGKISSFQAFLLGKLEFLDCMRLGEAILRQIYRLI